MWRVEYQSPSGDGAMTAELGRTTWPQLSGRSPLLVVPTGSCEQHGPHLPLQTDTTVATAVAARVVAALQDVDAVLSPAFPYGASGEHAGFPGTLSVGLDGLRTLVVELGRSARGPSAPSTPRLVRLRARHKR